MNSVFMSCASVLLLYVAHCRASQEELAARHTSLSDLLTSAIETSKRSLQPTNTCRQFAHFPNSMSLDGGQYRRIGEGYTHDHCTESCLATKDFICAGALVQHPGTCYLTGYSLRNDYFSTHYLRVCSHGPQCFLRLAYKSADFTNSMDVPAAYRGSESMSELFCMATCEARESCVGFGFKNVRNNRKCMFQDLQTFPDSSFDLYIRRC